MTTTPATANSSSLLDELDSLEDAPEPRWYRIYNAIAITVIMVTGPAILALSSLLGL